MFTCEQYSESRYSTPCTIFAAETIQDDMWCSTANFQNINKCNENVVAVLIPAFLSYQVYIQFYKVLKTVLLWIYFLYFLSNRN